MQGLLAALATVLVSRPCSEADIYAGWPLPKAKTIGASRPLPDLLREPNAPCSQIELVNIDLNAAEALHLTRAVAFPENGEFRNLSALEGIKSVTLDGIPVGDAGASVLSAAFSTDIHGGQNISISLASTGLTSTGAQAMAMALKATGSALSALRLEWNEQIGDAGAGAIGHALEANRVLGVLGLERCGVGDSGAIALATALQKGAAVRELRLEGNAIGALGTQALSAALIAGARLDHLGLALNPVGAEGAVLLAEALHRDVALHTLDLSNCAIGDEGAVALGHSLRGNTMLRKLILLGNGIGPRGVAALADALRIKPALNTLNLRLNHLGETAAAELLSAVKHAKSIAAGGESLTSLDLEYNTVVPTHGLHQPEPVSEHLLVELEGVLLMSSGSAASGASPSEADAPTTIGTQSYVG